MYIPATFFSTLGSCFTVTTSAITGSGTITTGSFVSGGFYWDYYKFEMTDALNPLLTPFTASLNVLTGSTSQAQLIVIGAGGSGANVQVDGAAGGGGGGGVVYYSQFTLISGSYEIGVASATNVNGVNQPGVLGKNSYFKALYDYTPFTSSFITAYGGGGGGVSWTLNNPPFYTPQYDFSTITGASAGGAAKTFNGATQGPYDPLNVYRNYTLDLQGRGSGLALNDLGGNINVGVGGGGASVTSSAANETTEVSNGGDGFLVTLTGTADYYAGGGGGRAEASTGIKGLGGDNYGGGGTAFKAPSSVASSNYGVAGAVVVLIPKCAAAFDCKTFDITGSGGNISWLPCEGFTSFETSSALIGSGYSFTACLVTLSGSNTPALLNGGVQSSTVTGLCDNPFTASVITNCNCDSYLFKAGTGTQTATFTYCGSNTVSSASVNTTGTAICCDATASRNITGVGSSITLLGVCVTGSCALSQSLNYQFVESGGASAELNIYNNGNTVATLTSNGSGKAFISTSTYVTASVQSATSNHINRLTITGSGVSLNLVQSGSLSPLTASFLMTNTTYITASSQYYSLPFNLSGSVSVSQSLAALYDIQYTQSYSGTGNTIYDLSGVGNNATIANTSYWYYNTSPLNTLMKNTGGDNTQIDISEIAGTNYTLLLSWYGKNPTYSTYGSDAPLLYDRDQDPGNNQYGMTALSNSVAATTSNGDIPLNLNVTSSATLDAWHISQISLNQTTGTGSYCLDGITGSYTGSSAASALQFSILSNRLGDSVSGFGSGSMFQVAAVYTSSLSTSQMLSNYNVLKDRYGL